MAKYSIQKAIAFYLGYIKPHKKIITFMLFLFVVKHSIFLAQPLIVKQIIDVFIPEKNLYFIYGAIGLMAVLGVINYFFHRTFVGKKTFIIKTASRAIRNLIVNKLQLLSFQYHLRNGHGKLYSKIMMDVERSERFGDLLFGQLLQGGFTLLFTIVVLARNNVKVLAIYLVILPLYYFIYLKFRRRFQEYQHSARLANEKLSQSISRFIHTSNLSRIHGEEKYEKETVDTRNKQVVGKYIQIQKETAAFGVILYTSSQVLLMIIIAVCAHFIIRGEMRLGDLVLFLSYITQLTSSISQIIGQMPVITEFSESIYSIREVLTSPNEEANQGKDIGHVLDGAVSFKDMAFEYDAGRPILNGITRNIPPGTTVALVGPSGSGKTTLVNLAIGLLRPTAGTVSLTGRDINDLDMRAMRKMVGVVTQAPILFPATIHENIAYGSPEAPREAVEEAGRLANAHSFIMELPEGYDTVLAEEGNSFSGGQKQRIAIARAIFRQPKLLILDEATSALDPEAEKAVQEGLDGLLGRQTTLVIAHRLTTIFKADEIWVFEDGTIAESGSHNDLIAKRGVYARLLKTQMGIEGEGLDALKIGNGR